MNFSPDKFSYTVSESVGRTGVDIVLTRLETGETKTFYEASTRIERAAGIHSHMNSLTDDLMMQWFQVRERKPKKEKK